MDTRVCVCSLQDIYWKFGGHEREKIIKSATHSRKDLSNITAEITKCIFVTCLSCEPN